MSVFDTLVLASAIVVTFLLLGTVTYFLHRADVQGQQPKPPPEKEVLNGASPPRDSVSSV